MFPKKSVSTPATWVICLILSYEYGIRFIQFVRVTPPSLEVENRWKTHICSTKQKPYSAAYFGKAVRVSQ